jgi:chemotaxis signal transduction protein
VNAPWMSERNPVAELRQAFDQSFADAPRLETGAVEDLLDVRFGTAQYALRVADISGLIADVRITPVSTPIPELMGIAGMRGSILPVYDLGAMLGYQPGTEPRWLAVAAGDAPVGLAFERFDGHLRVRADAIVEQGRSDAAMRHVRQVVHIGTGVRPIVSVASILDAIAQRVRAVRDKE